MPVTSVTNTPGVQIQEVLLGGPPIVGVGTSTAGFVGSAPKSGQFTNQSRLVTSADQFKTMYIVDATVSTPLSRAVNGFFANGGTQCYVVNVDAGSVTDGLKLLEVNDEVHIIAAPGHTDSGTWQKLEEQAFNTGNRVALLDPPALADIGGAVPDLSLLHSGVHRPPNSKFAAWYFPRILVGKELSGDPDPDPTKPNPPYVTPVGHIAGAYAHTDGTRGVHKAPANIALQGALGVEMQLTDNDQNGLNPLGVNLLRIFGGNVVIWGARTLQDQSSPVPPDGADYLYINVRRLVNYVEESLQQGLRWAVFEPNNLILRKQITRSVRGFLDGVWRDGALFGATADEAYYVRFPDSLNTDDARAQGKLYIEIGLRVTFPAEFIIVQIGLLMQSASTA